MENTLITKTETAAAKRHELIERRETLIHQFSQAARVSKNGRARRLYRTILSTNEFIETLDRIEAERREGALRRRFVVSSLFLHECFRELTADEREQLVYITGAEVCGAMVLDQRIQPEHESRTMMGVKADPKSTNRILIRLEQFKHRLLAHFHSHPGNGPDSTHPSGTDERFQKRLESAGHVCVAAIFSRDGFVRFFRLDGPVEIEVHGQGVEKHADNVFQLRNLD